MQTFVEALRAPWFHMSLIGSVRSVSRLGGTIARFSRVRCSSPSSVEVRPTTLTSRNGSLSSAVVRLGRTYKQVCRSIAHGGFPRLQRHPET